MDENADVLSPRSQRAVSKMKSYTSQLSALEAPLRGQENLMKDELSRIYGNVESLLLHNIDAVETTELVSGQRIVRSMRRELAVRSDILLQYLKVLERDGDNAQSRTSFEWSYYRLPVQLTTTVHPIIKEGRISTTQFLDKIPVDLLCVVCHEVPLSLQGCSNEHLLCGSCSEAWIPSNQNCPTCRSPMTSLLPLGRIARNMHSQLLVNCPVKGCGTTTTLERITSHLQSQCEKLPVQCNNAGCSERVSNGDLEHAPQCIYRNVSCPSCSKLGQMVDLQSHLNFNCPSFEVECECGEKLLRCQLAAHRFSSCSMTEVPCPIAGCSQMVKQKELNCHMEANAQQHILALSEELLKCQQALRNCGILD